MIMLAGLLAACMSTEPSGSQSSTVPQATTVPAATSASAATFAANVRVGGVDIGGLTPEAAREKLGGLLADAAQPLELHVGSETTRLAPDDFGLMIDADALLAEAQQASAGTEIALQPVFDETRLRAALEAFDQEVATPPTITVLTSTDEISRSFAVRPGTRIDTDQALEEITARLRAPMASRSISLTLVSDTTTDVRPTPAQLQEQAEALAEEWDGVVGLYVYDLDQDQVVASLNENTVFSGASVMKVPILLHAYANLDTFDEQEQEWINKMIIESDNLAANGVLASSIGGAGTDDALTGVLDMTDMLRELGLEHTYQYIPYEAYDYLVKVRKVKIQSGPKVEGPEPYTDADPVVRTTPAEMSQVFLWIEECSQGRGVLLETYPETLSKARCQEMIDLLEKNGDKTRMVAGFPAGTKVAHKSGWIEDMQSDVGLVQSPGGDFLLAVYVYTEIIPGKTYLKDEVAAPVLADFARLVYSYYNPVVLDTDEDQATAEATPEPRATSAATVEATDETTLDATAQPDATSAAPAEATAEPDATSETTPTADE